jgi:hypothetical protein
MPLPTFAYCPTCRFELDVSDAPEPLRARITTETVVCGRCGHGPMRIVRLFHALLAMPVTAFDAKLAYGQAGQVRQGAARA